MVLARSSPGPWLPQPVASGVLLATELPSLPISASLLKPELTHKASGFVFHQLSACPGGRQEAGHLWWKEAEVRRGVFSLWSQGGVCEGLL